MTNFDYDKILAAYNQLQLAMAKFIEEITPVMEEVLGKAQETNEKIHIAYLEAGTPYGDSDLGLWKWITDMMEDTDDSAPEQAAPEQVVPERAAQKRIAGGWSPGASEAEEAENDEWEWREELRKIREEFEKKP